MQYFGDQVTMAGDHMPEHPVKVGTNNFNRARTDPLYLVGLPDPGGCIGARVRTLPTFENPTYGQSQYCVTK